jgi:hypothetical protein
MQPSNDKRTYGIRINNMKVQELLEYIDMSRRIADEILDHDPDHKAIRETSRVLSSSQESVRNALSASARALNEASAVFEQYNLDFHQIGDIKYREVSVELPLSEVGR